MFYISDKEQNNFEKTDYFDGKEYVKKIIEAIEEKDIKSIGLYGKWGVGKTSILKNVKSKLILDKKYEDKYIIEYNAWKYNEFDFMRDFLIICSNKIESSEKAKEREESYYSDLNSESQIYKMTWKSFAEFVKRSKGAIFWIALLFLLFVVIVLDINYFYPKLYDSTDIIMPVAITLIGFILPLFLVSEISHKTISRKFSPEQFAREFDEIVGDEKILIIIDDIDRCNSDEIISTFNTLKTFILDEKDNVKFIIPIDPSVLINKLGDKTYGYFSKVIDYSIDIKNYQKYNFELLTQEILSKVDKNYHEIVTDGLYFASKYWGDTPRKIKKFANEFINEIVNFEPKELSGKGYMLSKLIILKNEFPTYYQELISNYNFINKATKEALEDYQRENKNNNYTYRGIKFELQLLSFLDKTSSVSLYEFPMFVYKMTYDEYKIKMLFENPISANKFDENIKIDFSKNEEKIKYYFIESIIKPLNNSRFLYADPLRKICFVFGQLYKMGKSNLIREMLNSLENHIDDIFNDENLIMNKDLNKKIVNEKYLEECISLYNCEIDGKIDDIIIDNILKFILQKISEDFYLNCNECLKIINKFNYISNIQNENLIKIVNMYLQNDFKIYYENLKWYFENSPKAGKICYVGNIIKLITEEPKYEGEFNSYLTTRYTSGNCARYLLDIEKNIDLILKKPILYEDIINVLISNINKSHVTEESLKKLTLSINYNFDDDIIKKLFIKLYGIYNLINKVDVEFYDNLTVNVGKKFNSIDLIDNGLKKIIEKMNVGNLKLILNYDEKNNIFNNFDLLKKYELKIKKDIMSNNLLSIIIDTYIKEEDFIIASDLERHGFNIENHKKYIIIEATKNINKYIYLLNELKELTIDNINFNDIDLTAIDFQYINNQEIKNIFIDVLIRKIDTNVINIEKNKDDIELIKSETNLFLTFASILYCDLHYSDRTFWTKLKRIEKVLGYNEMIDSFYIPCLKKYEDMKELFKTGKFIKNYSKSNIYSEKILTSVK